MRHVLISTLFTFFIHLVYSQNETDLYRFSKVSFLGSARYEAMGGSFGALGADLSSSLVNPAGYGRFSSSQAGMSIYGGAISSNATFNNNSTKSNQGLGGVSNLAIVLVEDKSTEGKGFLYSQLGFGVNRVENFKSDISYNGQQYASLLDDFTGQAAGYQPSELNTYFPFSTSLAWETYAINYNSSNQSYYSLLNTGDVKHQRNINTKGGQTELFLSYSFNYINKLYFGVNVGAKYHRYDEEYLHTETLVDTTGTPLRSFDYQYELTTKGWGGNLKIGAIYLFSEAFRVGLAIHTPTFASLKDNWSANMTANFQDSSKTIAQEWIPTGEYKYRIRNPFRFIASAAYVFGTRGCVNADLEFIDYRMNKFRSTNDSSYQAYNYENENAYAKSVFVPSINARIGTEIVIYSSIYLRAGFAYYGRAYKTSMENENMPDFSGSIGAGFKTGKFQVDIAYKYKIGCKNYYAFSQSKTSIQQNTNLVLLSFAYRF